MKIEFHYDGKFLLNSFSGGKRMQIDDGNDLDSFGFVNVDEYIKKRLGLDEIGGVYMLNTGCWELIKNDDDVFAHIDRCGDANWLPFYINTIVDKSIELVPSMQPHVKIRPSPNFIDTKRKFVTIQNWKA